MMRISGDLGIAGHPGLLEKVSCLRNGRKSYVPSSSNWVVTVDTTLFALLLRLFSMCLLSAKQSFHFCLVQVPGENLIG